MRRLAIELIAAIGLTLSAILAMATGVRAGDLMVTDAFARASATPVAKSGVAYLTVVNNGGVSDRLLAVSSPVAQSAQIHETIMEGDIVAMRPAAALDVPAHGKLDLNPGGAHIMFMGLKAPLKEGETVELVLTFERAGELNVSVPIGAIAADGSDQAGGGSAGN